MKKLQTILILNLFSMFLVSCSSTEPTAPTLNPNQGNVDLTRYVAIGNSITAGYQSGSLYQSAQEYSYGNLLAKQVGASFVQPLMSDPGTTGRMEVFSVSPFSVKYNTNTGVPINLNYSLPYNNLGVPGATLYDVLRATNKDNCLSGINGSPNPLFDLILRGKGTQFTQAKALNPTMLTLWIGNNDVLGFATSGGTAPPSPTPLANFQAMFGQLADSIASLNCKVIVADIPFVSTIPFFTTVGTQIAITLPWTAKGIHAVFYQKHGEFVATGSVDSLHLLTGTILVTLKASNYAPLIGTPTGKFYKDNNLNLPAGIDTTKPFGLHPQNPLPDALVLDENEITTANNAVSDFNNVISTLAANKGFKLVGMNAFFTSIRAKDYSGGTIINGIKFTTAYVQGGLFSLDGVHPSSQGQAIIANEFIKVINSAYNSAIPLINVATIPASLILAKSELSSYYKFDSEIFKNMTF